MSQALQNLLNLLNLEKLEEGLYRGQSEDIGLRQVFGGQVVGQALYAAKQTVAEDRIIHFFTAIFCGPAIVRKRLFTMLKRCVMAKVSAHVGSVPFRMGSRFFI